MPITWWDAAGVALGTGGLFGVFSVAFPEGGRLNGTCAFLRGGNSFLRGQMHCPGHLGNMTKEKLDSGPMSGEGN